jgi:formate dehydrogenase subunit gamma
MTTNEGPPIPGAGAERPHADGPLFDRSRTDRPDRDGSSGRRRSDDRDPIVDPALASLIDAHRDRPGALLPLLHAVQSAYGHVPAEAVPAIAEGLNLSRAEVHGVIGYYAHFHAHPVGRHVVQVCRAESCKAVGADALAAQAEEALGCGFDSTREDGQVTLEAVYCLGLCAVSPAALVDGRLHGRLTPTRFEALLADIVAAPARSDDR